MTQKIRRYSRRGIAPLLIVVGVIVLMAFAVILAMRIISTNQDKPISVTPQVEIGILLLFQYPEKFYYKQKLTSDIPGRPSQLIEFEEAKRDKDQFFRMYGKDDGTLMDITVYFLDGKTYGCLQGNCTLRNVPFPSFNHELAVEFVSKYGTIYTKADYTNKVVRLPDKKISGISAKCFAGDTISNGRNIEHLDFCLISNILVYLKENVNSSAGEREAKLETISFSNDPDPSLFALPQ